MPRVRYLLLVAVAAYLLTGLAQVRPEERDVVRLEGNSELPKWVLPRLQDRVAGLRLGVRVQRISVARLAAPDEVQAAFEAVNQAQTGIRTKDNQARQEADQRLRQADSLRY